MKLIKLNETVWINAEQITYYDESSEQLHFTDGERMRVSREIFKKLILALQEKKKTATKKTAN